MVPSGKTVNKLQTNRILEKLPKIMETNEKTEGLRQESEIVCTQSTLVKNKETKGQEKT